MGAAGVACAWLTLFPISPRRLYNMQIDLFQTNHAHTVFFFRPCFYLGTIFGAAVAGYCGDRLGRAGTLELAALPFLLGWVFVGIAYGELTVLLGRYFLGAAAGMVNVIVPIYLAEVSAAHTRGRVLCIQLFLAALGGMTYVAISALFLSLSRHYLGFNLSEWKLLAWIGVLPALSLLILAQKLPDSPTWLITRHDDRDASFQVLYQLFSRDGRGAEQATNAIIHAQVLASTERRHHGAFFRPLLLCVALVTLRAVSNFLLDPTITSTSQNRSETSFLVTILGVAVEGSEDSVLGGTLMVAGAAAMGIVACYYLVDTRGRLVALQCGAYAVAIACAFLLVSISKNTQGVSETRVVLSDSGWAAILLANAGHQLGLGVVPVILMSELFAVKQRLGGVSLVLLWEAMVQLGLAHVLPLLRDSISCRVSLFTLCVGLVMACNLVTIVLSWWYIPETSQRSLQAIEAILCGWQPATPRRSSCSHVRLEYGSSDD